MTIHIIFSVVLGVCNKSQTKMHWDFGNPINYFPDLFPRAQFHVAPSELGVSTLANAPSPPDFR